jgi:hypothetical protein
MGDYELEYSAACVVLAWGNLGAERVPSAASADVRSWLPVVIVAVDPEVVLPDELQDLATVDLGEWAGDESEEFTRLVEMLVRLLDHRLSKIPGQLLGPGVVRQAEMAVEQVSEMVSAVHRLDDVLGRNNPQTQALSATLRELGATYRVVKSSIETFFAAGLGPDGIDGRAYAFLERGTLAEAIHNGRAHCLRIGARYYREGGIRQELASRVDSDVLASADSTFEELTNSDHDMLAAMDMVGKALTAESRAIVVHLLTEQEQLARRRLLDARELLLPLEDRLDTALFAFQKLEASLGYAEDHAEDRGVVQVSIKNVNIGGGNVGCNIVVAELIKESTILLGSPGVPAELRRYLEELHKAVAALTTTLSDDDALLAARDLKDLTDEATSEKPRTALWQRAANGLLDTAKRVADVGAPVVDLVNKVVALLS